MQLDQSDIGTYQQRILQIANNSTTARFDGWTRAELKVAPAPELLQPMN
jgi:hypothetical protein